MSPEVLGITLTSLKVATTATLLIIPVGTMLGLLLARRRFPGQGFLEGLIMLPMVIPPVAVGLLLLTLLSPGRFIGGLLHDLGLDLVLTWQGAALAAFTVALPLYVRAAQHTFASIPRRYEQVARTLGFSRVKTFGRVTLPLAFRGLVHGTLLAFARALGEFGATILVAGNIPGVTETLALGIYDRIIAGRDAEAWTLAGISCGLAMAAVLLGKRFEQSPAPLREAP